MVKWLLAWIVFWVCLLFPCVGCEGVHDKVLIQEIKTELSDDMRTALKEELAGVVSAQTSPIKELATMVKDQGILDKFMGSAIMNYQEPNIAISKQTIEKWTIGIDGVNGRLDFSAEGQGSKLPAEVRSELIKELADPRLPAADRSEILKILEWSRGTGDKIDPGIADKPLGSVTANP